MEDNSKEQGISLSDILFIIKKRLIGIIVIVLLFVGFGVVYSFAFNKTAFQADSCLYVLYKDNTNDTTGPNISDINYGRLAPKTLTDSLLNDPNVWKKIEKVATEANNKLPEEERIEVPDYLKIGKSIGASYDDKLESLMFIITYRGATQKEVLLMINACCEGLIGISEDSRDLNGKATGPLGYFLISRAGGYEVSLDEVYVVSQSKKTIILIAGCLGVVVGIAYAFIRELTNQRIASRAALEDLTDIKVIGVIPEFVDKGGRKNG